MWLSARALQSILDHINKQYYTILERMDMMTEGMDKMTAAVDNNAKATDDLADEVKVAVDYIKAHPATNDDPELLALAARLEEKNAKAVQAKADLSDAVGGVVASGGAP